MISFNLDMDYCGCKEKYLFFPSRNGFVAGTKWEGKVPELCLSVAVQVYTDVKYI